MALHPAKRHVIPPAVEGERMRRYSIILMLGAFALMAGNAAELTPQRLLWYGSIVLTLIAIVLGTTSVVMRGLQWHYDRILEEVRGHALRGSVQAMAGPEEGGEQGSGPGSTP
jgi:uncharacterized membrane protein YdbT with pleckstrin-like domain